MKKPLSKKKLTIGMIGLGLISKTHIQAYQGRNDISIKAFSDKNHALLLQKGKLFGIKELYPDYRFMLEDESIDVIDVMTPHFLHRQCVCDALKAGKTVICEKPIATKLKDINVMIRTAKITKRNIYIKQYLRYSLAYLKAQHLLRGEGIGRPYFVQCTFTSNSIHDYANPNTWKGNALESGGGIFIDVGVHILDLLQMMFGPPISTFAQINKILTTLPQKGEDFANALIEFPNNLTANINCTENDSGYRFRWEVRIYGTQGVMTLIDSGKEVKTLQIIRENKVVVDFIERDWWKKSNIRALNDIVDRIRQNKEPAVSLNHAQSVLRTIIQSYRSARIGKKIYLT